MGLFVQSLVCLLLVSSWLLGKWCNLRLQVSQHNLAHHGDWYSCQFDVLDTAFVLDFVFSDTAKRSWDNNAQQVIKSAAASAILQ